MRLTGRRPDLPLRLPRLDRTSWPDHRDVAGSPFDVATMYEVGYREAFEPRAHGIAEQLVDEVLPSIRIDGAAPEDLPYLRRTFFVAAQVGAGMGIVEERLTGVGPDSTDRRTWAALWQGLRELPAMAPQHRLVAAYLMQSGYYVARTGDAAIPLLLRTLGSAR